MSALQIDTRPTEAATTSAAAAAESDSYGLADLRAGVLADRGTTVTVRAALGILIAVSTVIVVAGVATQSAFAMIGGGVSVGLLAAALVWLAGTPAASTGR